MMIVVSWSYRIGKINYDCLLDTDKVYSQSSYKTSNWYSVAFSAMNGFEIYKHRSYER